MMTACSVYKFHEKLSATSSVLYLFYLLSMNVECMLFWKLQINRKLFLLIESYFY